MPRSEDDSPLEMARRATTKAEFPLALNQLRCDCGLSYKDLADKAGDEVSKSAAHRLCTTKLPKREEQLLAFLAACEVSPDCFPDWVKEWQRLCQKAR